MSVPQGNQSWRKICDSVQDIGNSHFIGGSAIQFNKPPEEASGRSWQQPFGEVREDEHMGALRFRLRQLDKRASSITKMMTKPVDNVKTRIDQLQKEIEEIQEHASNLRAKLQDIIQQQKQKTKKMVSCGTQVNVALENDKMVSRGTQVSMTIVLKPVMSNKGEGTVRKFHNLFCVHQDGSADQMVHITSNRDTSMPRTDDRHLGKRSREYVAVKNAYCPLTCLEGNTSGACFGLSKTSRDNANKMNKTSASLDLMFDETLHSSPFSSPSATATASSTQTERLKQSNFPSNKHCSSGSVYDNRILSAGCPESRHWSTATALDAPHTTETERCDIDECEAALPNRHRSSNAQVKGTVDSTSSTKSSVVASAIQKLFSRSQAETIPDVLPASSQKGNINGRSLSAETHLLNATSSVFTDITSSTHRHLSPDESHMVNVSGSFLPNQCTSTNVMPSSNQPHQESDRCKNYLKSRAPVNASRDINVFVKSTCTLPRQAQHESQMWNSSYCPQRQFNRTVSEEFKLTNTRSSQLSRLENDFLPKPPMISDCLEHGRQLNQIIPEESQLTNPSPSLRFMKENDAFKQSRQIKSQLTKLPINNANSSQNSQFTETEQNFHNGISLQETHSRMGCRPFLTVNLFKS